MPFRCSFTPGRTLCQPLTTLDWSEKLSNISSCCDSDNIFSQFFVFDIPFLPFPHPPLLLSPPFYKKMKMLIEVAEKKFFVTALCEYHRIYFHPPSSCWLLYLGERQGSCNVFVRPSPSLRQPPCMQLRDNHCVWLEGKRVRLKEGGMGTVVVLILHLFVAGIIFDLCLFFFFFFFFLFHHNYDKSNYHYYCCCCCYCVRLLFLLLLLLLLLLLPSPPPPQLLLRRQLLSLPLLLFIEIISIIIIVSFGFVFFVFVFFFVVFHFFSSEPSSLLALLASHQLPLSPEASPR